MKKNKIISLTFLTLFLFGFEDCQGPQEPTQKQFRSCKVVKIQNSHHGAILLKKGSVSMIEKICTQPLDEALATSCPEGQHAWKGSQVPNRRYREVSNKDNTELYSILIEECWQNCLDDTPERKSCEYDYPKGCHTASKLVGEDPCKAFGL